MSLFNINVDQTQIWLLVFIILSFFTKIIIYLLLTLTRVVSVMYDRYSMSAEDNDMTHFLFSNTSYSNMFSNLSLTDLHTCKLQILALFFQTCLLNFFLWMAFSEQDIIEHSTRSKTFSFIIWQRKKQPKDRKVVHAGFTTFTLGVE